MDRIVALMEAAGMTAKVSSIHVNGWFGQYDKLSMAHLLMRERYGLELSREREKCMFVGDSPEDAPNVCLPAACGRVANVAAFAGPMIDRRPMSRRRAAAQDLPRWRKPC